MKSPFTQIRPRKDPLMPELDAEYVEKLDELMGRALRRLALLSDGRASVRWTP